MSAPPQRRPRSPRKTLLYGPGDEPELDERGDPKRRRVDSGSDGGGSRSSVQSLGIPFPDPPQRQSEPRRQRKQASPREHSFLDDLFGPGEAEEDADEMMRPLERHRHREEKRERGVRDMQNRMGDAMNDMEQHGYNGRDEMYAPDGTWEPATLEIDELDELDREDLARDPSLKNRWMRCFLCEAHQTDLEREANPDFDTLKLKAHSAQSHMRPANVARHICFVWNTTLGTYQEKNRFPSMRTRYFYEHFDDHAPSVGWMNEATLRFQYNAFRILSRNQTFEFNAAAKMQYRVVKEPMAACMKIMKDMKSQLKIVGDQRAAGNAFSASANKGPP